MEVVDLAYWNVFELQFLEDMGAMVPIKYDIIFVNDYWVL